MIENAPKPKVYFGSTFICSFNFICLGYAATSWLISNEIREVIRAKKYDFKITLALDQFWSLKKMVLERRYGE